MGRNVSKPEDWVTYVPNVEDNRDDPDPLTVEIKHLTSEQHRAYTRGLLSGKGLRDPGKRSQQIVARIFASCVRSVRNYVLNGEPITTGKDLFERGETLVIDDVYEAITSLSVLNEGMLGKSSSRSVSTPPGIAMSQGGAAGDAGVLSAPSAHTPQRQIAALPATVTGSPPRASASPGPQNSSDAPGLS